MTAIESIEDQVILVDIDDNEVGLMNKLEAHQKGLLHRAISVFAYDSDGNWILQKRAMGKYHSEGLWSNTCCSHPLPEESSDVAASRRLMEEMGMTGTPVKVFNFRYKADLDNELTEHELDHVFILETNEHPECNSLEVSNWRKISFESLKKEISANPDSFTEWFKMLYEDVQDHIIKAQQVN